MKQKDYERPTMLAVELQHGTGLLQANGVSANRNGYGNAVEWDWGDNDSEAKELLNPKFWDDEW